MTVRLVDAGWGSELIEALDTDATELRIICPFIKVSALERLIARSPEAIRVITRFNLTDFAEGVSDVAALRVLLEANAQVRGIKNLHAKLYLFGQSRAIITSANLTKAALDRNHEFGLVSEEATVIADCHAYFDTLWSLGDTDLEMAQVEAWDRIVTDHLATGGQRNDEAGLGDFGAEAGVSPSPPVDLPAAVSDAPQAFVKFLGKANDRAPLSYSTYEEVKGAGCHWAVAYPASKRPTGVHDGAVMFIGVLTEEPNDIRIFGRAIGLAHQPGRDDATPEEIVDIPRKAIWPRYIRVHHAEFVAGTMANGVSLNELMVTLGPNSFASTQRRAAEGEKNINIRRSYSQQAAVKLTYEGQVWLSEHLQAAFETHGKIPQDTIDELDWPVVPGHDE